jgi:glycogen synthase
MTREEENPKATKLRVLMATPRYFPYMGGVESHVDQVGRRLAQKGVDVTVLTTDPTGQLPLSDQVDGLKIQRVRAWPANRDYYFAPDVYRVVKQGQWDILHIQSYHTFVPPLAMLAARQIKQPYVVTFHGGGHSSSLRHALRSTQRRLLRPLLARAERLVAVAKFEIEFYGRELRIPRERFVLIPNGCDLPQVTASISPAERDSTLIASVGRLEKYKGHQRLIAALPYILAQKPDACLWIAGAGPYEADLRYLAQKLGVADHLRIQAIPAAERARMATELSKAALFVLLSEYETHPIAVLEALSLGCPALVADTSGLSELAERGLARAIPLNSAPQQVAAAVLEQLHHPLIPKALSIPTWDDCADGLFKLYQSIVQR